LSRGLGDVYKRQLKNSSKEQNCDIDGEKGPAFPLEIELVPAAQKVFTA
ncbi:MAG: diacylglycerol kinase catalytic subunit, partial [Halanaerobium sp.]